jgi:hypothetical protein
VNIQTRLWRAFIALMAVSAIALQGALAWGVTWAVTNQQWISDRAIARQFVPDQALQHYVTDASLTAEGEVYLYASLPQIVPEGEFDRYCSRDEPGIGVLGCYRLGEKRIYLYDVTDERLEAMEPVIAAHEMLHAAWDRFSQNEKDALGVLLEEALATLPSDHPMYERIASYEAHDATSRIPELYSLMGTEVESLPVALEAHYSRFIADRQAVVALAKQVYEIFDNFGAEVQHIVDDLSDRSDIIDELKATYERDAAIMGADISVYNERVARYNAGEDVSGASKFDQERDDLIARQAELSAERDTILELIDEYNALLDQLNFLNDQLTELNQGINIKLEAKESIDGTDTVD